MDQKARPWKSGLPSESERDGERVGKKGREEKQEHKREEKRETMAIPGSYFSDTLSYLSSDVFYDSRKQNRAEVSGIW